MKKLIALITLVVASFAAFSQIQSTEIQPTSTIHIETYDSNFCYFYDEYDTVIQYVGKSLYSGEIDTMWSHPHRFTTKYANWTPGQLIERSGYLKNLALSIGIAGTLGGAFMCAIPFFGNTFEGEAADWVCIGMGCGVAFGCGIASIALTYTANRLMQEAGLKMQKVQFTGNGVTVRF